MGTSVRAHQLSEDNLEELDELVEYRLHIGNFEQADALSRRMLYIAKKQAF